MPALGGEGSWWRREGQGVRGGDVFTWRHCEFIRPLSGILWPVFGYSDLKLKERMGLKRDQDLAEDPHNHLAETLPPGCTTELLFSMSKTGSVKKAHNHTRIPKWGGTDAHSSHLLMHVLFYPSVHTRHLDVSFTASALLGPTTHVDSLTGFCHVCHLRATNSVRLSYGFAATTPVHSSIIPPPDYLNDPHYWFLCPPSCPSSPFPTGQPHSSF